MRMILRLTLLIAITSLTVPAQSDDKTVVDKFIASQAKRERGEEPDDVRKTIAGDLNHDGTADVAVLYTIEGQGGSNNYIQYLAVFVRKKTGLVFAARTPVGGKNRRGIELTSIKRQCDALRHDRVYGSRSVMLSINQRHNYLHAHRKQAYREASLTVRTPLACRPNCNTRSARRRRAYRVTASYARPMSAKAALSWRDRLDVP